MGLDLALDVDLERLAAQAWVGLVVFICRAQFVFHPSDPMVNSNPGRQIKPKAQTKTKGTALADVSWAKYHVQQTVILRFELPEYTKMRTSPTCASASIVL